MSARIPHSSSSRTRLNPNSTGKTSSLVARIKARQEQRKAVRARRNSQVMALYPHARTFELKSADPIGVESDAQDALARMPRTITLVTPDHDDHTKDHLYFGPHPVLSENFKYDHTFEELSFITSAGTSSVHAHLRVMRSRTRAYGVVEYAGHSFAVEYEVKPQHYRAKVGKGAAYLAGTSQAPSIMWDVNSSRWKDAAWTEDYELGFTYGVVGEEIIGDEKVYDFCAAFDDITTSQKWAPVQGYYVGYLDRKGMLKFALQSGANPPQSGHAGGNLFPYMLRAQLSEFAFDFVGGMLADQPDLKGTAYGLQGEWDGGNVAGLYFLETTETDKHLLLSIHNHKLHLDQAPVETSEFHGNELRWHGLPQDVAQSTGLPESGHLKFSSDGDRIIESSMNLSGHRIHPDQAAAVASALKGSPGLSAGLQHSRTLRMGTVHNLTELLKMSQFVQGKDGNFYDLFQEQSMQDFYAILQNYMNSDLRKQFFSTNPPPLDPGLFGIAHTPGKKNTDPLKWYEELSVAYTCSALGKWSTDPGAVLLNARRADAWLANETSISDVMQEQAPLLYARRYRAKYDIEWYVKDQQHNAQTYEPVIDAKVVEWVAEIKRNITGSEADIQKVTDQIKELGKVAKEKKLYWAFAVYSNTVRPAYLNMLQAIMVSGDEIDGSELTQRVQRTVALLNVLDTSSYFSGQYAYTLQLFQVANVLPQLMDYTGDFEDFSFAVKQIVDKFIAEYINSADPEMQRVAAELKSQASGEIVSKVLSVMRTASAVRGGLYSWTGFAAEFELTIARVLGGIPALVTNLILVSAVGLMITFFITGELVWSEIPPVNQAFIIISGSGILAQIGLMLVKRSIAFGEVFATTNGLWKNFKLFFSPSLIEKAQRSVSLGFKAWLLEAGSMQAELEGLSMRALFADTAEEAAEMYARSNRINTLQKIFGRNVGEFLATRIGAFLATAGIVMSVIMLVHGGEPLEIAANSLFLVASVLELIATAGLWAAQAFAIETIGGIAVGTLFPVVGVLGMIAMVAGVVLIAILLFKPQDSPVTKFAKERAGTYYMPFKTDIDYFETYQEGNEPQRSGVSFTPNGDVTHALYIGSDGSLQQKQFDATGHTAFYLRVDAFGRAQLGAPILNDQKQRTLMVLALDDTGKLIATNATPDTVTNEKMLWRAEILGEGQKDGDFLQAANFKLYNEDWNKKKGVKRYISLDGLTGWKATDGVGQSIQIRMETTLPAELRMMDILWYTYMHDQKQSPGLSVPGSAPRVWSISPDLPPGLIFSSDTGLVAMKIGEDVPPAEKKTYKLSVKNAAGISVSTDFTIAIVSG
ncbi:MAG TPA: hypothetical protein VER76_08495 [Pyrinomonadaceae bacterium]|nr:hypothetical protein [Pyrinomonadaceae bacterium]